MPKKYERLRDKFTAEGMPYDDAQTKAAKIYNAQRKRNQAPVSGREAQRRRQARKAKPRNKVSDHDYD